MTRSSPITTDLPPNYSTVHQHDLCLNSSLSKDTKPLKKSRKLQIFNTMSHESSKTLVDSTSHSAKSQQSGFKGFIKKLFGISAKNNNKIETASIPTPAKQSFIVRSQEPISTPPVATNNESTPIKKIEPIPAPIIEPIMTTLPPIPSLTPVKRPPSISAQSSPSSSTASLPRHHPIRVTYKMSMRKLKEFPNKRPLHQLICIQQVIQNLENYPHLQLSRTPSLTLLERSATFAVASPTSMTAVCRRTKNARPSSKSRSSTKSSIDLLVPVDSSYSRYPSSTRSISPKPKSNRPSSSSSTHTKKQRHFSLQPSTPKLKHAFILDLPGEVYQGRYPTIPKTSYRS